MSDGLVPALAVRRRDVALAGHTGDEATAVAGLSDADPTVRAAALGALARLGVLHDEMLVVALTDHVTVARRAAELAATCPPGADLDSALLAALRGDDATLVEVAAWSLGERHQEDDGPGVVPVVEALADIATTHDDALCREAAVAALGATAHPRALPTILAATTDKTTVRRRAVIALASYDGPDVDAALARALTDRDWQVRQAAEDLSDPGEPDDVSDDGP